MKIEVFPITLPCNNKGWSAYDFRDTFLAARPDGLIWYGYDVIIHSRTDVEFIVYDMRDSFSGGLGKKIARLKSNVSDKVTAKAVEDQIMLVATLRREAELDAKEREIIKGYADEIRDSLKAKVSA